MEKPAFDTELSVWLADRFNRNPRGEVALSAPLAEHAGISSQAANARLRKLVAQGVLTVRARGRTNLYRLAPLESRSAALERQTTREDLVWREIVAPPLRRYAEPSALTVLQYGVTEMINNAHDHSDGHRILIDVQIDMAFARITVADDGEGIFARIRRLCRLQDDRESLLELAKGKLTTDPEHHSGEGVFFTSRAIDHFTILSGRLAFSHSVGRPDFLIEDEDTPTTGTVVVMQHALTSRTELRAVFDAFADPDSDPSFNRTVVPLRMAVFGDEQLMSRSQARRVLTRVERFKTVMLDFDGVEVVGQGFADEVFRVFAREHPDVELIPVHTTPAVGQMVMRAIAGRAAR